MSDYWRDYMLKRPGTAGGEQARLESSPRPLPSVHAPPGVTEPRTVHPRRAARKITKLDFAVGIVVFLIAWAALMRPMQGDVWAAAAVALFAGGIATWWWRHLLVLAGIGVALLIFFHAK